MKKLIVTAIALFILSSNEKGFTSNNRNDTGQTTLLMLNLDTISEVLVDEWLGEKGSTYSNSFLISTQADSRAYLNLAMTNGPTGGLCDGLGAFIVLLKNSEIIFAGDIGLQRNEKTTFYVSDSDVVTVSAYIYDRNNGVSCRRLGNINFKVYAAQIGRSRGVH